MLATQNPIEQEGTYPLPEAQVDRFMFKLIVDYPDKVSEKVLSENTNLNNHKSIGSVIEPDQILEAQK